MFSRAFSVILLIVATLAAPVSRAQLAEASPLRARVDQSVERGLRYLADTQLPNGAYHGDSGSTAAIPALAGMAFLSKGHLPGEEPYGDVVNRAIDYVLDCADMRPDARFRGYFGGRGNGRMYAHSIATLFLSEVSGMVDPDRQARMDPIIQKAVKLIIDAQNIRKSDRDKGGWRYTPKSSDSDMSCSGWVIMALRSARLNGARIPNDTMSRALDYVKRSSYSADGSFTYQGGNSGSGDTLTGAGILYLELCGRHNDPMALRAARFLTDRRRYTELRPNGGGNRVYGLYYASQGLFQIGGTGWEDFQHWMYSTWIPAQSATGSWSAEENSRPYATAMVVLAFTPPYRQLPIYQRDEQVDED